MKVIPFQSGPDVPPQILRVVLDGTPFQLYFRWNARAAMWRLDISDDAGNTLCAGLAVRNSGLPINSAIFGQNNVPQGLLLAIASADKGTDADNGELGARVQLVYATAAEVGA